VKGQLRPRSDPGSRPISGWRPTIGVLVTNYETWPLTRKCVAAALGHSPSIDAILVVDDRSSSPPPIDLDARAEVLLNGDNLGLVRSLNLGLQRIGTDLVVVFDADAYPLGDFTDPVRRAFVDDPRLALAAFRTFDAAGCPTASGEPEPDVRSLLFGQRLDAWYRRLSSPRKERALCVYACAMALRREAFLELGGFDERFDWLDFDHDFSMRVNRSSWRLGVLDGALAFHEGGGTPQRTSQRLLRFYKNRWLLLTKFGKIRHPRLVRAAVLARLAAERRLLRVLLRVRPGQTASLTDKLAGRELALAYGRQHYR
jgi:GT2 family glycosyltransferase